MMAPNYSTREGAELLAAMVYDYWAAQGIAVRVRIDEIKDSAGRMHHIVQSDMRNGAPRGVETKRLVGARR